MIMILIVNYVLRTYHTDMYVEYRVYMDKKTLRCVAVYLQV